MTIQSNVVSAANKDHEKKNVSTFVWTMLAEHDQNFKRGKRRKRERKMQLKFGAKGQNGFNKNMTQQTE